MFGFKGRDKQKRISKKVWAVRIGLGLLALLLLLAADTVAQLYFINGKPLPPPDKFLTASPVNLSQIIGYSKYRSCQGHDFSGKGAEGTIERNRSMKHYLVPRPELTDQLGVIEVKSPVDGKIVFDLNEGKGHQLIIEPTGKSGWGVVLFHVDRLEGIGHGVTVKAGQLLGHANVKGRHDFDIALTHTSGTLIVERLSGLFRGTSQLPLPWGDYNVSAFDYMTDEVIAEFTAAGLDMSDTLYTREQRDQNPCNFDESYRYQEDWVYIPGAEPQTGPPEGVPPAPEQSTGQPTNPPPAELYPPTN